MDKTLRLELVKVAWEDWRREEARAFDGVTLAKISATAAATAAHDDGISYAEIAEAVGVTRQRVHQLVTRGR